MAKWASGFLSSFYYNQGLALQKIQRHDEALASLDKAIACKPDYVEAHYHRGLVLQALGRGDDALTSFDKAIVLKPSFVKACHKRGDVMVSKGKMDEAEKMFTQALELDPEFPNAWLSLTNIRKYRDPNHADVKSIKDVLDKPGLSPGDKEYLYFSLGKIYDNCGLYDQAFEYYRQANEIRNAGVTYDPKAVAAVTDDIINVFNKDFMAQSFPFGSNSRSPVFIVGMPRSGTTLLANILSNHPAIETAGELPTIINLALRLPKLIGKKIPYPQAVRHVTPAAAERMITDYEKRLRRDVGPEAAFVIDKHPLNFGRLGFIAMLFPKAHIIHCTRHPMDTGLSTYFQRFSLDYNYAFDLRNIGHFYNEYARIMKHWQDVLPGKITDISYEDMILNTEGAARRALDLLGLEWDERCLSPHTNPRVVETASNWQVRQPIYRQSVERWRHYEKHLAPLKEALHFDA